MSLSTPKKKRGRPATGRGTVVSTRLPDGHLAALEDYAARHKLTRSKALKETSAKGLQKS